MDRDGLGYVSYAEHLAIGEGYREDTGDRSHRGPGYPLLIATTFFLGGHQFLLLRLVQAGLGTLVCWLLHRLARSEWGEEAGRRAALVSAVYPPFIFYSPQVLNSTLYMTLVVAVLLATFLAVEGSLRRALGAGALLGAAALTAGTLLGAAPALALWLGWRRRSLLAPALMALGTLTVLSPWIARNFRVHHTFVLLDTNSGGVLYLGNPNFRVWTDPEAPDALDAVKRDTDYLTRDEAGKDRLLRGLAFRWMREHPGEFMKVWASKFLHGWSPLPSRKRWPLVVASLLTYGLLLALGLAGAVRALRQGSSLGMLLIPYLVAISMTHAVFLIAQRHRVPLFDPALVLLAVVPRRCP